MKIYAKASLDVDEIKEKIRCGCDGIEYNLTSDFYEHGYEFETYYDSDIFRLHNIEVVHAPSDEYGNMMCIEEVMLKRDISDLENVFRLAEYVANIWKHRIIVVLHCSLSLYAFNQYEILQDRINDIFDYLFRKYPSVDVAIENVIFMEFKEKENYMPRLCNGIADDISSIVKVIRKRYGNRVGTVLDTCHAMMTEKYMNLILKETGFNDEKYAARTDYSLESFFNNNRDVCKLIHFNSFKGNGYRKNHGILFESKEKVMCLLEIYKKYNYVCPLTIEIREDNYLDCKNYTVCKGYIEDVV